ncbi:MAG TPA: hypothetical protein VFM56_12435, partial [Solimonas sp.]|nr:hypothetical protein [Solimonas sp.]
PASLDAALAELALLDGIRAAIAAGGLSGLPRLLIGAAATAPVKGAVMRLMASRRTAQEVVATNLMLQQQRAAHDPDCRYLTLPYDHGALVFEQGGARASAAEVLAFVRAQRA